MKDLPERYSPLASYDGKPRVHQSAVVRKSVLGRFTEIKERVNFAFSSLGDYSYIERHSEAIYAEIGKFCAIAANVRINALEHPTQRISQHKFTYRANEYFFGQKLDQDFRQHRMGRKVVMGHDVWLGHGVVILPHITIGTGAVIGANAVVTKDVAPYAVMAGVPAKFLRWRFPPEISEQIMALAWWDWAHDKLALAVEDMRCLTVEAFLEKYKRC